MKTFTDYLKYLNACDDAIEFSKEKTFRQAYFRCENNSWILWLFRAISSKQDIDELHDKTKQVVNNYCIQMNVIKSTKYLDHYVVDKKMQEINRVQEEYQRNLLKTLKENIDLEKFVSIYEEWKERN